MAIYDNDGTTNYGIGKLYDNDGTTSYQIGKVYDSDGTTNYSIYTAEETFTQSVTSGAVGRDESYGSFGTLNITLSAGETFRIDNITFDQKIYSNIDCDLYVNGTQVWDYNATRSDYYTHNSGVVGTYTAVSGKVSIMLRIRGWRSSGSWNGTFHDTATITYTTGV